MLRSAFRSFSPSGPEGGTPPIADDEVLLLGVAEDDQSATEAGMAILGDNERALVDALDDPALVRRR